MNEARDQPSNPWPEEFLSRRNLSGELAGQDAIGVRADLDLPEPVARHLMEVYDPLAQLLAGQLGGREKPLVLGLNGAQGTGKSTAAQILARLLQARGWRVCQLSIDDLYLTRAQREALAEQVHPLLITRGVPGTHDLGLGERLLTDLCSAESDTRTLVPRFDKARDDRKPERDWDCFLGRPNIIIFEGWCLGARPQIDALLSSPCNSLERLEDPKGKWRHYVNRQLHAYQPLFAHLDRLVLLQAPSFQQVYEWRALQERKLEQGMSAAQLAEARVMSPAQLVRFISHYERLTRWILTEMPSRADLVLALDAEHRINRVTVNRAF